MFRNRAVQVTLVKKTPFSQEKLVTSTPIDSEKITKIVNETVPMLVVMGTAAYAAVTTLKTLSAIAIKLTPTH